MREFDKNWLLVGILLVIINSILFIYNLLINGLWGISIIGVACAIFVIIKSQKVKLEGAKEQ